MMVPGTGAAGEPGCVFTVTADGAEIHVILVVLLTRIVCGPEDIPAKICES
jgi:hypothetical protein